MRASDARKREKKKKDRSPSPVSGCAGMDVDEAVTTGGTWTGEKKTKIQRDVDLGRIGKQSDRIASVVDHDHDWLKEIEEFDWDYHRLKLETDQYVNKLNHSPPDYDDMERPDEKQLTEMMSRLAMYRLRAYKGDELKGLDNDQLVDKSTLQNLEAQGYYKWCECALEWFFDPETFYYVGLEDYQRLMLHNNNYEYEDETWQLCHRLRSTCEGDKQYVEFWNKLSNETKWIEKALTASPDVWDKLERVAYYRAVKIAAEFPDIYSTLIFSGFTDYKWSNNYDKVFTRGYAWLYLELWKLVAKQKIDFNVALDQLSAKSMPISSSVHMEFELSKDRDPSVLGPVTRNYKTFIADIDGELEEHDAYPLIMEAAIKIARKPKIYYDYAIKKLKIAEEIGMIPRQTKQK
ncbi:hypothetical protein QOZ80_3AG0211170 [Eleusine coracana subsp. coracana]|nr:hypothetical protein QOZ80_3AG0211170 [Eleusine coracana subsp. coracana]